MVYNKENNLLSERFRKSKCFKKCIVKQLGTNWSKQPIVFAFEKHWKSVTQLENWSSKLRQELNGIFQFIYFLLVLLEWKHSPLANISCICYWYQALKLVMVRILCKTSDIKYLYSILNIYHCPQPPFLQTWYKYKLSVVQPTYHTRKGAIQKVFFTTQGLSFFNPYGAQ